MDERQREQARRRARRYRARKRGEDVPRKKPGPPAGQPYRHPHYWHEGNLVTFEGTNQEGQSLWRVAGSIPENSPYLVEHPDGTRVQPGQYVESLAAFFYAPGEPTYSFITYALFDGLRFTALPKHRSELAGLFRAAAEDWNWSTEVHGTGSRLVIGQRGRDVLVEAAQDLESGAPFAEEKQGFRPSIAYRDWKPRGKEDDT